MKKGRRNHSAEFKARVALEAIKGIKSMSELASEYAVHPTQISTWKKQVLEELPGIFSEKRTRDADSEAALKDRLYQQIGQLQFELDWLKKSLALSLEQKRGLINPLDSKLSVSQQCELLGLTRSSYYYEPLPASDYNLGLMRLMDAQYLRRPFYGSRRMRDWLRDQGHAVCRDRIRRLMRRMGIEAIYPRPRLSVKDKEHRIYPYLLRELVIDHADQVWAADITYIRLRRGFAYLVAIMDWYSRYVLAWELSVTLEAEFCLMALNRALTRAAPEIFNTDQGSQFTGEAFTGRLAEAGVRISMDGRGRTFDNIMIERLWRSVKYEEVYLKDYENLRDARKGLAEYFEFYNNAPIRVLVPPLR